MLIVTFNTVTSFVLLFWCKIFRVCMASDIFVFNVVVLVDAGT